MKNISKSFLSFIKSHKVWSIICLVVIVAIAWYGIKKSSENIKYETVTVSRGSLLEIVSVTGNVKPLSDVNLAFERGGRVADIAVSVGDTVYAGQALASVSNADLLANVDQAQANLKKALAQYQDVKTGTRAEEITLQNTQVEKSALDLSQAKISLINAIKDSYTKADDAVKNKMYSLFTDAVKYRAKLAFTTDTFLQEDIEDGKDTIADSLDSWYRTLSALGDSSNLETYYNSAKLNLTEIKKLLDKCAEAVNGLSTDASGITQSQIDTWKLNISSARTSVDLAISSLTSNYDAYKTGTTALKISQDQLLIKKAGSTDGQILSAEATYESAQAGVASAEAELAKSIIRSPITGVVTNIDTKLGEIVSANKNVISVISYGEYEVESFIPEADISKVKINNQARTTLDAYGDSVTFDTSVIKIDPSATVIDGVPTYKVTLKFTNADDRIRSGMTANLDIQTNQKDNVLVIPSRVVTTRDDGKYVSVLNPNDEVELLDKKVVTGLRGSDGNIEIVSGLSEGDKVVSSTI